MVEALHSSNKAADRIIDQSQIHNEIIFQKDLYSLNNHSFLNIMKFISDLTLSYKNVLTYLLNFKTLIDENFTKTDNFFELFTKIIITKLQEPIKLLHQHDIEVEFGAMSYKMKEHQLFIQNLQKLIEFITAQIPEEFKSNAASQNREPMNDFSFLKLNLVLNSYVQRVQETLESFINNQKLNPSVSEGELREARSNYHKYIDEHSKIIENQMNFLSRVESERYRFLENLVTFCNDMKTSADEKYRLLKRVQLQFKACIEKRKIFSIDLDYLMNREMKLNSNNPTMSPVIESTIGDESSKHSARDNEQKRVEVSFQKSAEFSPQRPKSSATSTRPKRSATSTRPLTQREHSARPLTKRDRSPNTSRQTKRARRPSIDKTINMNAESSAKTLEKLIIMKSPARKLKVVGKLDNKTLIINEPTHPSPISTRLKTARSGCFGDHSPIRDSKDYKIRTFYPADLNKSNNYDVSQAKIDQKSIQKRYDTNDSKPINLFDTQSEQIRIFANSDLVALQKKVRELVQMKLSSTNTRVKELASLDPEKIDILSSIHQASEEILDLNESLRKLLEDMGEEFVKCAELEQIAIKIEKSVVPSLEALEKAGEKIKGSFYNSSTELSRALPIGIQRIDKLLIVIGKNSASQKLKPFLTDSFEFYIKLKLRLMTCNDTLRSRLFQAKQSLLQFYQQDFKKFALLNKEYSKFLQNAHHGEKYFEVESSQKLITENAEYKSKFQAISEILSVYISDNFQFEIPKIQQCVDITQKLLNSSVKLDNAMQIMMATNNQFLTYNYENITIFNITEQSTPLKQFLQKKCNELDDEISNSPPINEEVGKIMKRIASVMNNINAFFSQLMALETSMNEIFNTHLEKVSSTMKQELETAQNTVTMLQSKVEKLSIDFLNTSFKNQPNKTHPVFRLLKQVISTVFDGEQAVLSQLVNDFNLVKVCHSLWTRTYKKFSQLDKFLQGLTVAHDTQDELYRSIAIIQSHNTNFLPNYDRKYLRKAFEEKVFPLMKDKIQQVMNSINFLQKLLNYNESFSQTVVESQFSAFSQMQNSYDFFTQEWKKCKIDDPNFPVENDVRRLLKETNAYIEFFLTTVKGINDDYSELKSKVSQFARMGDIKDEVKQVYFETNNFLAYCKDRIIKLALVSDSHFSTSLKKCVFAHNEELMSRLLSVEKDFGRYFEIEHKVTHSLKGARHGDIEVQELFVACHDIIVNFEENYMKVGLLNEAFSEKAHIVMEKLLTYLLDYTKSEIVWALKVANALSITAKDQKRFRLLRNFALLLVKQIDSGKYEKLSLKVKSKAMFQMHAEFLFLLDKVSMLTNKYLGPVLEAANLEFRKRLAKLKEFVLEVVATIKGSLVMKEKRKKLSELNILIIQECRQGPDSGEVEPLFLAMAPKFQEFFGYFDKILSQEGKSEEESTEINGFIAKTLRDDIYYGDFKTISNYKDRLTKIVSQYEQSNFAETSLVWLEIFYHTHVLIHSCESITKPKDNKKQASLEDLKSILQEVQKTLERLAVWEKHHKIQDNIESFEKRKKILVSIKDVMESYCKLIELEDGLKALPQLYTLEKKFEDSLKGLEFEFKEVISLVDFLDRVTTVKTRHIFRETFYCMKQKHEAIRQLFYEKRVGFAEKNSIQRLLFLLQNSLHYLLNQVILLFKSQKNPSYSHLLSQIFSERNTSFTLRIVKMWEIDYSEFVIHAWAQFNIPQISTEVTIWISPVEFKIQGGLKDPAKNQMEIVRDPDARFLLNKEYLFTWNVHGSQIEGLFTTSFL